MRIAFFWIILLQFSASFVVTILGVIGKVQISPGILNSLVTVLILEQAAAVIGLFKKTDFFGTIESLSDESWSLLATLWKFQIKSFPNDPNTRWYLALPSHDGDYSDFISGYAQLKRHNYVEIQNGQVFLSRKGYQFAKSKDEKLKKIGRLFWLD